MNGQDLLLLLRELDSPDQDRAWEAADQLWGLDTPEYIPFLCLVIEHSRWDYVVDRAASRLARLDGPPILVLLAAVTRLWKAYARRNDIDSLLKNTGYAIADSEEVGERIVLEQLNSADVTHREVATLFLPFISEETAVEKLLELLRGNDDSGVRTMAVSSLGQLVGARIDNETAFDALLEASNDPEPKVRSAAILDLSLTCHSKAKEVLQRARNDESELVRHAVTEGIKQWKGNGCGEI